MTHNKTKTTASAFFHISPRYLAASWPIQHQAHIAAFGTARDWSCRMSAFTLTATSPCGRITMHHDQRAEGRGPHLVITAGTGPGAPDRWRIDVAGNTPVEFVAALTTAIAEHLEADPELIELTVDPHRWEYVEESGLSGFQSRDGRAFMIGRPADSPAPPLQGDESIELHIGAVTGEHGALWAVSFTHQTPPTVVNSVLRQTFSPEPVTRPASQTLPAALAPLVTVRAARRHPGPGHPPPPDRPPHRPGIRRSR
ncbi:DUF317 domain-containing protein [Streptomyces sp. NPDC102274]|uniref:DUF317 domain-containing protein n=1 Tax=Streptomyces sp. NPDC102274 TaxID=3366151 RepID=UPI0038061BCD